MSHKTIIQYDQFQLIWIKYLLPWVERTIFSWELSINFRPSTSTENLWTTFKCLDFVWNICANCITIWNTMSWLVRSEIVTRSNTNRAFSIPYSLHRWQELDMRQKLRRVQSLAPPRPINYDYVSFHVTTQCMLYSSSCRLVKRCPTVRSVDTRRSFRLLTLSTQKRGNR